jgi:hypothetical protein
MFFVVAGIILLILSPLLLYSSKRLMEGTRNSTYLAAAFSLLMGVIALYIGIF